MQSQKIVINAVHGMHARPAAELVKLVKSCSPSKVSLTTPLKTGNALSMLSILSLGLRKDTELTVTVEDGDEERVLHLVVNYITSIIE